MNPDDGSTRRLQPDELDEFTSRGSIGPAPSRRLARRQLERERGTLADGAVPISRDERQLVVRARLERRRKQRTPRASRRRNR
jgi:hypothetical protein